MGKMKFYSTPVLEYLDCENEGVLCQSAAYNDYGTEDL